MMHRQGTFRAGWERPREAKPCTPPAAGLDDTDTRGQGKACYGTVSAVLYHLVLPK